ncbi:MAG: helicase HerA domain-containing protein [Halobacteriaceae archaeon]
MSTGRPEEWIVVTEDAKTLPVIELLTGRAFITGKSGSGKSNTASVVAEELLDAGFNLLVVDLEGEYYGLKEEYQVLHLGADDRCDVQVTPADAETVADVALHRNMPTVLDVSGFTDVEESKAVIHDVLEALYEKERDAQKPFLVIVEEIQEHLPQSGGKDDLAKLLIRIAKRGRKRGLGMAGISQRPSSVDKDFITQCDWMVWHRLTWKNDIGVVEDILGDEVAEQITDLDDGEGFLMTDWDETVERVQFKRKRTFDAGATPGLQDFDRPDLVEVSNDLIAELGGDPAAGPSGDDPATLEDLGGEPEPLDAGDRDGQPAGTDPGDDDAPPSGDGAARDGAAAAAEGPTAPGEGAETAGSGHGGHAPGASGSDGSTASDAPGDDSAAVGQSPDAPSGDGGTPQAAGTTAGSGDALSDLDRDALEERARGLRDRVRRLEDEVSELRSVLAGVRGAGDDADAPAFADERPTGGDDDGGGRTIRRPEQPGPPAASGPAGVVEEFGHLVRYVLAALGFLLIDGTRWLARLPGRAMGRVGGDRSRDPIRSGRRHGAVLVGLLALLLVAFAAALGYLLFVA